LKNNADKYSVIFFKREENSSIKKKIILFLFISYFLKLSIGFAAELSLVPDSLKNSRQLVRVLTPEWNSTQGVLTYYERTSIHQPWHQVGQAIPVVVGKNGMAWGEEWINQSGKIKQEGDGRSPAGIYSLGSAFGFASDSHAITQANWPYFPLKESTICVDDETSSYYNQLVDSATVSHWNPKTRGERMLHFSPQYTWGIVIQYNKNNKKGAGSCIFMHVWKNPSSQGTAGCVAMAQDHLIQLLRWLDPTKAPVIALFPRHVYLNLQNGWKNNK
jgi:D-alanyl-D-alanine dipeptidase